VRRLFAGPAVVVALVPFHWLIQPLTGPPRAQVSRSAWHQGCPVALSDLSLLTVSYVGFDGGSHTGELVVNRSAAAPLARVFRELYRLRFHIRHMSLAHAYGPARLIRRTTMSAPRSIVARPFRRPVSAEPGPGPGLNMLS
jgi:hypothetical protein